MLLANRASESMPDAHMSSVVSASNYDLPILACGNATHAALACVQNAEMDNLTGAAQTATKTHLPVTQSPVQTPRATQRRRVRQS